MVRGSSTRKRSSPAARARQAARRGRRAVFRKISAPWIELFFRAAGAIVPRLRRPAVWRLGAVLGDIAVVLDRRGARIARANLRLVYGERLSQRRRAALVRAVYRTAARTFLDVFWFSRDRAEKLAAWTAISPPLARRLREAPGVVVGGHFGNWEIAAHILAAAGIPITSVAKDSAVPALTRNIHRLRTASGQDVVSRAGAIRGLVRAIRAERRPVLLIDQHTDREDGGVAVDFLGSPAYVSGAAAMLARRFALPVLAAFSRADSTGHYRLYARPPILPGPGDDVETFTAKIVEALTAEIRRHPCRWLWMYKRWKRIPPGGDPSDFPFYAHRLYD